MTHVRSPLSDERFERLQDGSPSGTQSLASIDEVLEGIPEV
ncbi:hypothetical protein [Streptomyces blattellae]|nr:hypothetical protein [Streptomyces blattellae]